MFVESLIKETEELLEKISLHDLVELWNEIFQEEKISQASAKEYSSEIVEELRSMVIDELEDTGLDRLITIHNKVAEEQISEDDIYDESNGMIDEDGEYL